jgi:WD domain, G-beta repeat
MANPKPERIATPLIALTAGDIGWDERAGTAGDFDWSKTNAVPRQLSGVFREEPQWVDLRTTVQKQELRNSLSRSNSEFMRAVAQLAAPIRGVADFSRLVSEDYRQYRRTIWTASAAAAVLAFATLVAVWQWRTAVSQADRADNAAKEAVAQRDLADRANAEAQANAEQARANATEAKANAKKADANAEQAKASATEAKGNAEKAQVNAEKANANLREAQIAQSRYLADEARRQRTTDPGTAVLLALEALPDNAGIGRPYVPEAELQLDGAWRDLRERLVLGHKFTVNRAAFSPDGQRIVTACSDKTARIWDAVSGQPIGEPLRGHDNSVFSAAFSPDGKRIVTASADGTARIWDGATGQPIGEPLKGHHDVVVSASFSPDGKRIVTASADHTSRIWEAASGKPIGEPL